DSATAYRVLRFNEDRATHAPALAVVAERVKKLEQSKSTHTVAWRVEAAYAAACLFRAGRGDDASSALDLTNRVAAQLDGPGRLCSPLDPAALLALLAELRAAGLVNGRGRVEAEGTERVRVAEGLAVVEVTREVVEDWDAFARTVEVRITLEQDGAART